MGNGEWGILIPNLLTGVAGCETSIEIFFNPHSAFPIPHSLLPAICSATLVVGGVHARRSLEQGFHPG
jgi:hypothetical protein